MIIIDANIIIRAVLGRQVRKLIENYSDQGLRFFTPDVAFADAERYLPDLFKSRGRALTDLPATLEYLVHAIELIDRDAYGLFEQEARVRQRGRDEEDWPILASALALSCGIWTEDTDFFGTGVAVWTTSRIEIFFESEVRRLQAEAE